LFANTNLVKNEGIQAPEGRKVGSQWGQKGYKASERRNVHIRDQIFILPEMGLLRIFEISNCVFTFNNATMANTNIDINIQLVFAVKNHDSLLRKEWRSQLYQYITGVIQNHNHKMLRINGMSDHIHIFIGYDVNQLIPDLVEEIKTSSNKYIKDHKLTLNKFAWQSGYGAFSYSHDDRDKVINYIINQQEHHRKKTFQEEYMNFIKEFEIEYKAPYLFEFFDIPASEL